MNGVGVGRIDEVARINRRLGIGLMVSLLCHALLLALQFGVPGIGTRGQGAPPMTVRLAPVEQAPVMKPTPAVPLVALPPPTLATLPTLPAPPTPPTPIAHGMTLVAPRAPEQPSPVPSAPPLALQRERPRLARRRSSPLPARHDTDAPTRVITQDQGRDDTFKMAVPRPDEGVAKTIDPREAQHGSDQGEDALNTAADAAAAQLAQARRDEAQAARQRAQEEAELKQQAARQEAQAAQEQAKAEEKARADALQAEQVARQRDEAAAKQQADRTLQQQLEQRQAAQLQAQQAERQRLEQMAQQQAERLRVEQFAQQQADRQRVEQLAERQRVEQLKLKEAERQRVEQLAQQRIEQLAQQELERQRVEQQAQRERARQVERQRAEAEAAALEQAAQAVAAQAAVAKAAQAAAAQAAAAQAAAQAAAAQAAQAAQAAAATRAAQTAQAAAAAAQAGSGNAGAGNASGNGGKPGGVAAGGVAGGLAERARDAVKGLDILTGRPPPVRPRIDMGGGARRAVVGAGERDVPLRMYVDSFRQKIERNGGLNYPSTLKDRIRIDPLVSVTVRSDGSVDEVTLVVSSGRADTDEIVRRIVALNARYAAFPPNIAARYDVIEIRRVWHFDETLQLLEEVR